MATQIDLLLPFFNPKADWGQRVQARYRLLSEADSSFNFRLILIDDGSQNQIDVTAGLDFLKKSDVTFELVQYPSNHGKGYALREGLKKATSQIIVFTDIDFPYEIDSITKMALSIAKGADVSLGYREDDYYASVPLFRKVLSEAFRFVLKSILRFPITDTQCGLKGMNQKGKQVFLETTIDRFLVDMEFIKRATQRKELKVEPVVVKLRSDVEFSSMGIGILLAELKNFVRIFFI